MKNEQNEQDKAGIQATVDGAAENGRREFLKKAGRFAVYTPPAVMLLMRPSQATVLKSAVGQPGRDGSHKKFGRKFGKGSDNYHKYKKHGKSHR